MLHQVEQAAWRCHHHVGAAAQTHHLRIDRNPAEDHGHLGPLRQMLRQASDDFTDLGRQLARRHEHECTRAPRRVLRPLLQALQQGQGEGGRLAGAGLGTAQ